MDNQQEKREDVYEAYVDASVALFMQYYCDILDESITKNDDLPGESKCTVFPEDLDTRCRSLIKRTMKRKKIQQGMRSAGKTFRTVCRVAVACLALISLLFVTVEAVRVPIINYYVKHAENSILEVRVNNSSRDDVMESFDPADPLAGILTDEYQLVSQNVASEYNFSATYAGTDNSQVYIKARPLSKTLGVDMEGAENIQHFQIYNCEAFLVEENNRTRLIWIDEDKAATFILIVIDSSDLDAVFIADQIIRKIS